VEDLSSSTGSENDFKQSAVTFDIATCMYYTGIEPFSGEEMYVAKGLRGNAARLGRTE
jgi:hypothetical protein